MKKLIKVIGILVCLTVLFLNVSLNKLSNTGNIDLSKLMVISEAEAECYPPTDRFMGECSLDKCFYATLSNDCDPTQN